MFLLVILVFLTFGLIACMDVSQGDSTKNEGGDGGEAEEVETVEPETEGDEEIVEIGFSGPLSGSGAQYGMNIINGMNMAANEINKTGFEVDGTTYKIEIVALDDEYLPNETGVNVKRMVSEDGPPAILIPHSGGVLATQEFNEEDDVMIMAYTSEAMIYEQENDLMLGIPPKYSIYPETFSEYMQDNFGDKMAVLPTNSEFGMDWKETIIPLWEEKGGEIVYDTDIDFSKETDYFTVVTNALDKDPDVLFVGGPSEPTSLVIDQARDLGFEGGFMIMDQAKMEEMSGFLGGYEKLDGSVGVLPIEEEDSETTDTFVKNYKNTYDEEFATSESGLNYQSIYLLVEAMKAAGTVDDSKAIMDAVEEGIENYPKENEVLNILGIKEDGNLQYDIDAGAVEDGEVVHIPLDN